MPSFCIINSCKRVKQPGDPISFHKFPFYNPELNQKWFDFVQKTSKRSDSSKTITKYSSICSLHFKSSEFNPHGSTTRKFLKRSAVPSISTTENVQHTESEKDQNEILLIDEPIIYESCGLCKTQSAQHQLHLFDEFNFTLMRKCIPFINFNVNLMQKICVDCEAILNTFSSFIDKILIAQNLINQEIILQQNESQFMRNIKIEPPPEEELSSMNCEKSQPKVQKPPPQKKLEILEIVDIKPMNFPGNFLPYDTNALSCDINESYEEAASQLKVEIADDGDDDLEEIKKYMLTSSACMHDHNYHMENQEVDMRNIKTEYEVQEISDSPEPIAKNKTQIYICCKRKFKSFKVFLLHKLIKHKKVKTCKLCKKIFPNEIILSHHKKYSCKKSTDKKFYKNVIEGIKKKKTKLLDKPINKKSYTCSICKKHFKGPKNLYQHKLSHQKASITCQICGQVFKRKHGLKQHIAAQHEKKRMYNCPICNHPYALKGDIKRCKHSDLKKNSAAKGNNLLRAKH